MREADELTYADDTDDYLLYLQTQEPGGLNDDALSPVVTPAEAFRAWLVQQETRWAGEQSSIDAERLSPSWRANVCCRLWQIREVIKAFDTFFAPKETP